MKTIRWVYAFVFLLAACSVDRSTISTPVSQSTVASMVEPSLPATNTNPPDYSTATIEELIAALYASDIDLPQYDPASSAYAEFPHILQRFASMKGPGANNVASPIAHAISFERQDAYLAAQALIALGPEVTLLTLPVLIDNLHNPRPAPRLYSAIVLGTVGNRASCAVGDIGPLLWDEDPQVRFAAAFALEKITEEDLLPGNVKADPDPLSANAILSDLPEGEIVGDARTWWTEEGSKVNWHPTYGLCDP